MTSKPLRRRCGAYADAAPDLIRTVDNTTQISNYHRRPATEPRRVPGQRNRSGRHRQRRDRRQPPGADRCAAPARAHHGSAQPSTTNRCIAQLAGSCRVANSPPLPGNNSAVVVSAGLTLGTERYRYPAGPAEGRRQGPAVLQGTGSAQRAARVPRAGHRRRCRRQPVAVRESGHPAELRRSQAIGCSGRSTDRRATPHRSECPDDALRRARSSSSPSSRS